MKSIIAIGALFLLVGLFLFSFSCVDDDDDDNDDNDDNDDDAADDDDNDDDAADDDATDDDDDDDTVPGDTWTDAASGLTWEVTPLNDYRDLDGAKDYCQNLTLAGGGWRLPTITELRTLIRDCAGTVTGGTCNVTDGCMELACMNDSCIGCDVWGGPGTGGAYWPPELAGAPGRYWSTTEVSDYADAAWCVDFNYGQVGHNETDYNNYLRCVRP